MSSFKSKYKRSVTCFVPGASEEKHAVATDYTRLSPPFGRRDSHGTDLLPAERVGVESVQIVEVHRPQAVVTSEDIDLVFVHN